ncbi:DUF5996 family protein [Fodinibius saliphilus]|uniref:DUF5996 family protein n=1 Tax=Fodinibius saliphilus TaxID=1920650 RepID=UPI001108936C|nr:DUF5996 family protein [Fodinibius saliphilus]
MEMEPFPALPLDEWKETKQTLHLYVQIVGKIRMELTPHQNHWWHVPLYVNTRGLGTSTIPYKDHHFEINFDFIDHQLTVTTSQGEQEQFELYDGLSVSEFYQKLFGIFDQLDIDVDILAKPYDQPFDTPFPEDKEHNRYDKKYVERYWKILSHLVRLFQLFNRDFKGKVCPVQLYWHSFDLAVTRFSGDEAPPMPEAGHVDQEAYSHEVISFGFWAGDENIPNAALYSYTFPAPEDLDSAPLEPDESFWTEQRGSPMALLMYEDVRNADDPEQAVLNFLRSSWEAGVEKAGWDTSNLIKSK